MQGLFVLELAVTHHELKPKAVTATRQESG